MPQSNRHPNYDTLNLIGYGLSKFDKDFVRAYGFQTKIAFYEFMVQIGVAGTVGTVKNRQDLFDGMVEGTKRKGWWQKGAIYKHRMDYIDSLFGMMDVAQFVEIVKLSVAECIDDVSAAQEIISASPLQRTRFKQMQETGYEAECYFMKNYHQLKEFCSASIEDARLYGDGYDFQVTQGKTNYLAEVKGLVMTTGSIRLTKNEFMKAKEYTNLYAIIVVSNLRDVPRMSLIFDPANALKFKMYSTKTEQIYYSSAEQKWA